MLIERAIIAELVKLFGWEKGDGIFSPGKNYSNCDLKLEMII